MTNCKEKKKKKGKCNVRLQIYFSFTGDRLLEVDGTNVQSFTYQQAVECLSKTGEVI